MLKLFFCQNDLPMGESFLQKDSLMTHIFIELCLLWYLAKCTFFLFTLYIPNLFRRLSFPFQNFKFKCWGNLISFCSTNIQVYTEKSVHGWTIQHAGSRKELRQSQLNSNTGSAIRNWYKVKTCLDQMFWQIYLKTDVQWLPE